MYYCSFFVREVNGTGREGGMLGAGGGGGYEDCWVMGVGFEFDGCFN